VACCRSMKLQTERLSASGLVILHYKFRSATLLHDFQKHLISINLNGIVIEELILWHATWQLA
jgi:hypothetical protein